MHRLLSIFAEFNLRKGAFDDECRANFAGHRGDGAGSAGKGGCVSAYSGRLMLCADTNADTPTRRPVSRGGDGFVLRCMARSYRPVITVALDRIASCLADAPLEGRLGLLLRCFGTGHMEDLFFHERAVQVVNTVIQRNLSKRQGHRNPITGDMIEVI